MTDSRRNYKKNLVACSIIHPQPITLKVRLSENSARCPITHRSHADSGIPCLSGEVINSRLIFSHSSNYNKQLLTVYIIVNNCK